MLAHLVVDLFVAQVGFDADAGCLQFLGYAICIAIGIGNDCRDNGLYGCKPDREATGIMLDQNADETFIAAEDCTVEHDGAMLAAIFADIAGIQTFGQNTVRLDRADLPGAADCVGQVPFELGRVKSAFAGQFFPAIFFGGEARLDNGITQLILGFVPVGIAAEALFGAQRELDRIGEAEILVDPVGERAEILHFLHDLVFAAEDVRVVLSELAHAHQAMERAVRFVAVAAAMLEQAQRQVAVRLDTLTEDQDMRRAVHRLQRHPVGVSRNHRAFILGVGHLVRDDEHILAIFAPVARLLPLVGVHHLRGLHLAIACIVDRAAHIAFELPPDGEAMRVPEYRTMRLLLQVKQVHLAAQFAMVALGGFFEAQQVRVELLLVEPAGAIDARKLGIILVAAPIGPGNAHQLECSGVELSGRGQMRAAAHIHPVVARPIDRQLLTLGQFGRPLGLEAFASIFPGLDEVIARNDFAAQRLVGADDLAHRFLDRRQVILGKRAAIGRGHHVIIETVVGCRAKGNLRAGVQFLHRLGKHMRKIVAGKFQRIRLILRRDQREVGIGFERTHDIAHLAIDARGQRSLGEAGADRSGNIRRGGSARNFSGGAIGKGYTDHFGHWICTLSALIGAAPLPAKAPCRKCAEMRRN